MILITLNGFISISVYSICYEYVVELTPGIGESITGGAINYLGNFLGFVEINVIQILGSLDKGNEKKKIDFALIVIQTCLILALILLCFVKEDKNKS